MSLLDINDINKNTNMILVGKIVDLSKSMEVKIENIDVEFCRWLQPKLEAFSNLLKQENKLKDYKIFVIGIGVKNSHREKQLIFWVL